MRNHCRRGEVRRARGGRRAVCENDPGLVPALELLVEPATLGDPISVDTKEKQLIGNFKNGGTNYRPKGNPQRVTLAHESSSRAARRGG